MTETPSERQSLANQSPIPTLPIAKQIILEKLDELYEKLYADDVTPDALKFVKNSTFI